MMTGRKSRIVQKTVGYFVLGIFALSTLLPFYIMIVMGTHKNS